MPAPITEFRQAVKAIVSTEFAADGLSVRDDKLHASLGHAGPVAAIYPELEKPGEAGIDQVMLVVVQLFRRYDLQIDPEQRVDPALIEGWVHRLQTAFAAAADPMTQGIWYFNVAAVEYPDDPTENKSRAVLAIEGYGNGPRMVETGP